MIASMGTYLLMLHIVMYGYIHYTDITNKRYASLAKMDANTKNITEHLERISKATKGWRDGLMPLGAKLV